MAAWPRATPIGTAAHCVNAIPATLSAPAGDPEFFRPAAHHRPGRSWLAMLSCWAARPRPGCRESDGQWQSLSSSSKRRAIPVQLRCSRHAGGSAAGDLFAHWYGLIPPIKEVRDQTVLGILVGQARVITMVGGGACARSWTVRRPAAVVRLHRSPTRPAGAAGRVGGGGELRSRGCRNHGDWHGPSIL